MAPEQSWDERLEASDGIDIRPVPEGRRSMTPGKSMLYPSARMVNDAILAIPEGQSVTPKELRTLLANQHNADYTCPVTTTMMLRVVAEAANEAQRRDLTKQALDILDDFVMVLVLFTINRNTASKPSLVFQETPRFGVELRPGRFVVKG